MTENLNSPSVHSGLAKPGIYVAIAVLVLFLIAAIASFVDLFASSHHSGDGDLEFMDAEALQPDVEISHPQPPHLSPDLPSSAALPAPVAHAAPPTSPPTSGVSTASSAGLRQVDLINSSYVPFPHIRVPFPPTKPLTPVRPIPVGLLSIPPPESFDPVTNRTNMISRFVGPLPSVWQNYEPTEEDMHKIWGPVLPRVFWVTGANAGYSKHACHKTVRQYHAAKHNYSLTTVLIKNGESPSRYGNKELGGLKFMDTSEAAPGDYVIVTGMDVSPADFRMRPLQWIAKLSMELGTRCDYIVSSEPTAYGRRRQALNSNMHFHRTNGDMTIVRKSREGYTFLSGIYNGVPEYHGNDWALCRRGGSPPGVKKTGALDYQCNQGMQNEMIVRKMLEFTNRTADFPRGCIEHWYQLDNHLDCMADVIKQIGLERLVSRVGFEHEGYGNEYGAPFALDGLCVDGLRADRSGSRFQSVRYYRPGDFIMHAPLPWCLIYRGESALRSLLRNQSCQCQKCSGQQWMRMRGAGCPLSRWENQAKGIKRPGGGSYIYEGGYKEREVPVEFVDSL